MSIWPSLSKSKMATPLPVVSRMYFLTSLPPVTLRAVRPASSAMSRKSTLMGGRLVWMLTGLAARVEVATPWKADTRTSTINRKIAVISLLGFGVFGIFGILRGVLRIFRGFPGSAVLDPHLDDLDIGVGELGLVERHLQVVLVGDGAVEDALE